MTFAMFGDPDGLLIGLMKPIAAASSGMRPPTGGGPAVDWFEVLGSDAERTQSFYRELFGWRVAGDAAPATASSSRAPTNLRGLGASQEGMRCATVYASVDDVERYLARAERLGGERVYGPIDVDDQMRAGALRDPAGNVFGIYHHPPGL